MADPVEVPEKKSPFISKRFYLNLIGVLGAVVTYYVGGVESYFDPNGAVVMGLFAALNMVLAFVSKGNLSLKD